MHIALVTAKAARELDDDLPPLLQALRERGENVTVADWDDASIRWSDFDIALLRSTWDYSQRLPEFLAWAARVSAQTHLRNPLPVIRWNTDKHYLRDLEKAGVAIVPSAFIEPGDDASARIDAFLSKQTCDEFVVKPSVGAGSRDAQRYSRTQRDDAVTHAKRLLDANRSVLLQPYLDRVDEYGETALLFFDGTFSHAIRKGPLLKINEGSTRALFAAEHISAREPSTQERALADKVLSSLPFAESLLYARVDLIQDADGHPVVLELELTEPSLFFAHAEGSSDRFVDAIARLKP
jgi:O-ureido-D-serine cyclo-ligase